MPVNSYVVRMIIVAAITLALLEQVIGVTAWIIALLSHASVAFVIEAVLVRIFGYSLEPATEAGRVPLGD